MNPVVLTCCDVAASAQLASGNVKIRCDASAVLAGAGWLGASGGLEPSATWPTQAASWAECGRDIDQDFDRTARAVPTEFATGALPALAAKLLAACEACIKSARGPPASVAEFNACCGEAPPDMGAAQHRPVFEAPGRDCRAEAAEAAEDRPSAAAVGVASAAFRRLPRICRAEDPVRSGGR